MTLRRKRPTPRRSSRELAPEFLCYVRALGCAAPDCEERPVFAHHLKHRATGGSDYTAIGLCFKHHREVHDQGAARFGLKYGVDLAALNQAILERWKNLLGG